jgi:dienelactone hydrolase
LPGRIARIIPALSLGLALLNGPGRVLAEDVPWLAQVTRPPERVQAERVGRIEPLLVTQAGQPVTTVADWEKRRVEMRAAWLKFLGPMPAPRPPVKLEILRTDETEGFTRQLFRYEGEPGLFDEAYVLRPRKSVLKRQDKHPGLVALHQTARTSIDEVAGVSGSPMQHLGASLANRGFVVVCPRNFLWPTTTGFDVKSTVRAHRERHPETLGMHKMLYDAMRAVDVLASLEDVDPQRLGTVGHSLGAKEVLYLLAFDERLRAGVASEGGLLLRSTNWRDPWYLGKGIDEDGFALNHHQLLALSAPRPMLILAGEKGSGAADGDRSWAVIEPAQEVYALYGEPVRLGQYNHGQGHSIPPAAYSRLEEWLVQYVAE